MVVGGGQDDVVVGLRSAREGVSQGFAGLERVCVGGRCYSGGFGPCLEEWRAGGEERVTDV